MDRRWLLECMAGMSSMLLLTGCFRPLLASGGSAADLRGRIAFPEIDGPESYHLYQALEDQLGTPVGDDFLLRVRVLTTERGLAVAQDNAVTRRSLTSKANWSLYRKGEDIPVITDVAVSQSGYNSTGSLFATRETRLDVERRLARDLGERIARSILARAGQLNAGS